MAVLLAFSAAFASFAFFGPVGLLCFFLVVFGLGEFVWQRLKK